MKKLMAASIISMVAFSGCGLKMVNKDKLIADLDHVQGEVLKARNDACSPEYVDKIDGTAALLKALIAQFE